MTKKEYNGWANYETWYVALWFDNEQGSYNIRKEWAQDAYNKAEATENLDRDQVAALALSDVVKQFVEDNSPLSGEASMYADLLRAAISEVDWYEIAENWLEDVEKEGVLNE